MNEKQKVYRFITGVDDSNFCHRVTEALSKGWSIHGSPSYAFDATEGVMKCGQAVTKDVEPFDYTREVKLGEF
ncbi:DUF1737 domain-containing protein [Cohaesibacter celericrescens]|uniref:DUF1737 domain-containing protein n=1 Tax=Cohaesibacter celericrescens TaxID=2067669 RepID=A0A2N5XPG1_9HYPH|nr:DUF1737 domain-containing protein [Cohaesibacter celericrescens]PLW76383.1 hypothetical protein C0081_16015 [Cohaesibacter celericrescens]